MFNKCACNIPEDPQEENSEVKQSWCNPCSIAKRLMVIGGVIVLIAVLVKLV